MDLDRTKCGEQAATAWWRVVEKVARQLPADRLLSLLKIPSERVATKTPNAEKSRESSARF